MQIENFYQQTDGIFQVSREQASNFAKRVAGDFNPIHDPDHSRFCVPGDLLFSIVLHRFGLKPEMRFTFSGMVTDKANLALVDKGDGELSVEDEKGKQCIAVEYSGEQSPSVDATMRLADAYVRFSGLTFPHLLVPLLEHQDVMINPSRPMVIYANMALHLQTMDFSDPNLEVTDTWLDIKGKRGVAKLAFNIKSGDEVIGTGHKELLLAGLQSYDETESRGLIDEYEQRKQSYLSAS